MDCFNLENFNYSFPRELIAKYPLSDRSSSRLMVINTKNKEIYHKSVYDLPEFLNSNDLIVINDTKVFKARLYGKKKKSLGKVEILLIKRKDDFIWEAMIKSNRKINIGLEIDIDSLSAKVIKKNSLAPQITPIYDILFDKSGDDLIKIIDSIGHTPLPPYIKREAKKEDSVNYQTIYAKNFGAAAAPTAGLHFTDELLKKIEKKSKIERVTLHVGAGTFLPVEVNDIRNHKMHTEEYIVSDNTFNIINNHLSNGNKITAVGTTSLRTIETLLKTGVKSGFSNIFIYPGYEFIGTHKLLTNFHQPKSTLFMLVCAFAGTDFIKHCYNEAIKKKYRLFSYGDAMLIL